MDPPQHNVSQTEAVLQPLQQRSWSTQSNAAERSRRPSRVTCRVSAAFSISDHTHIPLCVYCPVDGVPLVFCNGDAAEKLEWCPYMLQDRQKVTIRPIVSFRDNTVMGKTDRRTDELAVTISRIACLRAIKMKLFWDTELFSLGVVGYRTWSQYERYQQGNSAFAGAALPSGELRWRKSLTTITATMEYTYPCTKQFLFKFMT